MVDAIATFLIVFALSFLGLPAIWPLMRRFRPAELGRVHISLIELLMVITVASLLFAVCRCLSDTESVHYSYSCVTVYSIWCLAVFNAAHGLNPKLDYIRSLVIAIGVLVATTGGSFIAGVAASVALSTLEPCYFYTAVSAWILMLHFVRKAFVGCITTGSVRRPLP